MSAEVFGAVADPTRRTLLERLRVNGPQPLGVLAADLPMTRQAVTKHLDALQATGLVRVDRHGRERIHSLEPAPLRALADWLAPDAAARDRRLARLDAHLEENP